MHMHDEGIAINKAELTCLLEFAMTELESPHSQVRFISERDRLLAYATDGRKAIEADAVGDPETQGEWALERPFLELVKKTLTNNQRAILLVKGATLRDVRIEDQDEDSEEWTEASELSWPRDAASSQTTIEFLRQVIKLPTKTRGIAPCVTYSSQYLGALQLVGKAAGSYSCDLYAQGVRDPLTFQMQGKDGTTWTGVIMPMTRTEDDDETPKGGDAEDDAAEE